MVDFAIIVVSYWSGPDLQGLLSSLPAAVSGSSWTATIVNNAVDDRLQDQLDTDDRVKIIDAGGNLGYSGGINIGLAAAEPSRWTVILNPDVTLMPGSLTALGECLSDGADAAVPLILDSREAPQPSLRREPSLPGAIGDALFGDRWRSRPSALSETVHGVDAYGHPHPVDWATGAVLAIRSDVVKRIGQWDERRFFMYSEETDYARRIRDAGGIVMFTPAARVGHRAGGSGSSPQLDALLEVNKLRYYRKWHGVPATSAFWLILMLRNLARPHRSGSRAAVRALLSARARAELPGGAR